MSKYVRIVRLNGGYYAVRGKMSEINYVRGSLEECQAIMSKPSLLWKIKERKWKSAIKKEKS